MENSNICTIWLMVILSHALLGLYATPSDGFPYNEDLQQPKHATGDKRRLSHPLKSSFRKRPAFHSGVAKNAKKKALIETYQDPDVTVTVTESVYVTTTVAPKCYLTTTQVLIQYVTSLTEAATATETATTHITATETATTLKVTETDTAFTTQVVSTEATKTLTTQTVLVTSSITEVAVTDTTTVAMTVTTPHTVISTAITTQTPTPVILVETGGKRDLHERHRYRRVKRSWYANYIPKFVKGWIGMEE